MVDKRKDRPYVAAWKAAYAKLDNSTLLALVPVLTGLIEEMKPHLENSQLHHKALQEAAGEGRGHLEQAMSLREQGIDVSKYIVVAEKALDVYSEGEDKNAAFSRAVFAYLVDLETRKQWIHSEACRRGLLPDLQEFLKERPYG
jgi:hypothetical protein